MKIRIFAMFLLVVLLLGTVGCTMPSNSLEKTTDDVDLLQEKDNTEDITLNEGSLKSVSSSITASTVSSGIYLHIVGRTQGEIKGECNASGDKKGTVEIVDFCDGVIVPVDNLSGLPSGRRAYEEVTFVHKIDRTSPLIRKGLSNGEQFDLTVDFYRLRSDGTEVKYYSITYKKAYFVSAEIFTREKGTHFEEVSFVFNTVEYNFCDGNINFEDVWNR